MKVCALYEDGDFKIENRDLPKIESEEVLIEVRATGICGSDIHRITGEIAVDHYPIILGHEFAGDVVEVGRDVDSVRVGDRVTGVPLLPCHCCVECQQGNFAQCGDRSFIGEGPQGSFAEFIKLPERNVLRLDEAISYEQGALIEPSSIAVHVLRRVDFSGGDDVAILGGGTIGLFIAQWAKLFGAKRVFVFDIHQEALDRARRYGADVTLNTLDVEFLEKVLEYTDGKRFGYVFEAAGVEATFRLTFQILGTKSKVCCVGKPCPPKDFPFLRSIFENLKKKEFILTGSTMSYSRPFPGEAWQLTLDYLRYGRLIVDDGLIREKLLLTEIEKAKEMILPPRLAKGKIMLMSD